jgi:hypothetical protein
MRGINPTAEAPLSNPNVPPPAYTAAITDASNQRAEAAKEGKVKAALPTPLQTGGTIKQPTQDQAAQDQNNMDIYHPPTPPVVRTQTPQQSAMSQEDYDRLAEAMRKQMEALLGGWTPHEAQVVTVQALKEPPQQPAQAAPAANPYSAANDKILIQAGTVLYGQLQTEANSDVGDAPILAKILSGPYTGASLIGHFETTRYYLLLHFSTLAYHDREYSVDVVALDPDTTFAGMATETDGRYFSRVVVPAAAAFVGSFGNAVAQSGTVVSTDGTTLTQTNNLNTRQQLLAGLGGAGTYVQQVMTQDAATIKPLVRIAAGTPMGLMFVTSMKNSGAVGGINNPYGTGPIPGMSPGYNNNNLYANGGGTAQGAQGQGFNQAQAGYNTLTQPYQPQYTNTAGNSAATVGTNFTPALASQYNQYYQNTQNR